MSKPNTLTFSAAGTLRLLRISVVLPFAWLHLAAAAEHHLQFDFGRTNSVFRPLHGINKGPLVAGGIVDLSEAHRELAPPLNRMHDCHWPNPDVVDIHAVFPNPAADPLRPESYDFAATDEFVKAVHSTGAQIMYRLGESIEHTTVKRFVHPPKDVNAWAKVCVGIARHYNQGWAGGMKLGIRYWEIWNEPENRPVMWTGSDEQFLEMYAVAAVALKAHDRALKVGGPSFGYTGQFEGEQFKPSPFVTNFLGLCRRENLPLDFFSWHCYTADPSELVKRSRAVRALLDSFGFTAAESHLNEWNYLPGNSWEPLSRQSSASARQRAFEEMSGAAGAAFIAAALIELQDAPVDAANLYHAEVGAFGLFSEHGVPLKNFYAFRCFRDLLRAPRRVAVTGTVAGKLAAAAGIAPDGREARLLISNFNHDAVEHDLTIQHLPWLGSTEATIQTIDANSHGRTNAVRIVNGHLRVRLPRPGVASVVLRKATNTPRD